MQAPHRVDELCATAFNVMSNVVMLIRMLEDPKQRVPVAVLVMQVLANACWFSFALARADPYLMTTSASSGTLQCLSAALLARAGRRAPAGATRRAIPSDRSTDALMRPT